MSLTLDIDDRNLVLGTANGRAKIDVRLDPELLGSNGEHIASYAVVLAVSVSRSARSVLQWNNY